MRRFFHCLILLSLSSAFALGQVGKTCQLAAFFGVEIHHHSCDDTGNGHENSEREPCDSTCESSVTDSVMPENISAPQPNYAVIQATQYFAETGKFRYKIQHRNFRSAAPPDIPGERLCSAVTACFLI